MEVVSLESHTKNALFDKIEDRGKKMRMIMVEKDINTSQLAAVTGLSIATISNLRTGKIANPHNATARLIAHALDVDISDIWSISPKPS
jgi:transcriptional regulator with XRE-family HTH domain